MCTVSILRSGGKAMLTMNRDESKFRGPETPPSFVQAPGGSRIMAPRDSDAGGTWIGVNAHGVAACVLNVYGDGIDITPTPGKQTRGRIVIDCLSQGAFGACVDWARTSLDAAEYNPFMLVVVSAENGAVFRADRKGLLHESPLPGEAHLLTSSAWKTEAVEAWRAEAFAAWCNGPRKLMETIPEFHMIQGEGEEDISVLMNREWSCTRSVTQVVIDTGAAVSTMRYWPIEDCSIAAGVAEKRISFAETVSP